MYIQNIPSQLTYYQPVTKWDAPIVISGHDHCFQFLKFKSANASILAKSPMFTHRYSNTAIGNLPLSISMEENIEGCSSQF